MAQVRGINTVLALGEESTYGTAATGNFVKIFHAGETLNAARNFIDSQTLGGGRVRTEPIAGNWEVSGDIRTEINAESMLFLLKHAVESSPTKSGASAPFTFTFEPDALHTGMTLEVDYGSDISGAGRIKQLVGCRVAGFEMDLSPEGIPLATWRILGAKPTVPAPSGLTDASPATFGTHQPFSAFQITLTEEGSALAKATALRFSYDNGLEGIYTIGSAGARGSMPEGFVTVEGEMTILFDSASLLNKALNSTESKLLIEFTRGAGTGATTGAEKLSITLEELKYAPTFPTVEGPSGILCRLPFKCYQRSTALAFKAVALIPNDLATIAA
jgi:hypothetical protein